VPGIQAYQCFRVTVAGNATGIFYLIAMVLSRINAGEVSEEIWKGRSKYILNFNQILILF
jgi:hypothetical protein